MLNKYQNTNTKKTVQLKLMGSSRVHQQCQTLHNDTFQEIYLYCKCKFQSNI